jgi:hypothetical protein
MTPKERLKPVDKNVLLSSILKFFLPGNWQMMRSTHIIEATCNQLSNSGIHEVARPLLEAERGNNVPPNVHAVHALVVILEIQFMQFAATYLCR